MDYFQPCTPRTAITHTSVRITRENAEALTHHLDQVSTQGDAKGVLVFTFVGKQTDSSYGHLRAKIGDWLVRIGPGKQDVVKFSPEEYHRLYKPEEQQ